jgi:glycine/D-amino acid oxidase-like deaminating enzyme
MKIAIIGAGFCGLAAAWYLLNHPEKKYEVTLFDSGGIGSGASGIAAGLLHPYVGASAKLNWKGKQGFEAACQLLEISSLAIGQSVVANDKGILRLALNEKQIRDFQNSNALEDPHVEWLEPKKCQSMISGCPPSPGLWIKNGISVYAQIYLQGLWMACQQKGALFQKKHISSLSELQEYSISISTAGAATKQIAELDQIPLKTVKGQVLELEWPASLPTLPCALISQAYMVMKQDQKSCLVGSTYEKNFSDAEADMETAKTLILPKAVAMIPALKNAKIIDCYAGLRAVAHNHLPLLKQINPKHWVLTGMGSKGLLYHALFAQELVKALSAN